MTIRFAPTDPKTESLTLPQAPGTGSANARSDMFPLRGDSDPFKTLSSPRIHLGTTEISHTGTETVSLRDTVGAGRSVVINVNSSTPLSLGDRLTRIKDKTHELLERADIVPPASPTTFSSNIVAITRPTERIIA